MDALQTGLIAGLYKDYVGGGPESYIVVFGGTNLEQYDDWFTNFHQGYVGGGEAYDQAMGLAEFLLEDLPESPKVNGPVVLKSTGHSLGGGLASAAAIWANLPGSHTFQSAGLKKVTVELYLSQREDIVEGFVNPGVFTRYDDAAAGIGTHVKTFHNPLDILTTIQDATPKLQSAIGERNPYTIPGPHFGDKNATLTAKFLQTVIRSSITIVNNKPVFNFPDSTATLISLYSIYYEDGFFDPIDGFEKLKNTHSFYQQGMLGASSTTLHTGADFYGEWLLDNGSPDPMWEPRENNLDWGDEE